jgi:hypothetical protein
MRLVGVLVQPDAVEAGLFEFSCSHVEVNISDAPHLEGIVVVVGARIGFVAGDAERGHDYASQLVVARRHLGDRRVNALGQVGLISTQCALLGLSGIKPSTLAFRARIVEVVRLAAVVATRILTKRPGRALIR